MNFLVQLTLFILLICLKLTEGIQTNYDETFILPQYTYIEFLRSTVKLLESEYEPGSISAFLYLTGIKPTKNPNVQSSLSNPSSANSVAQNGKQETSYSLSDGPVDPSKLNTYDLLMFSDPNNLQFKNYIKAMQNQQWEVNAFQDICIPCDKCYAPMPSNTTYLQINFTDFQKKQVMCCTGCSTNDMIVMNILGLSDSVQFKNFEGIQDSPMIIIIDNTPFPDGNSSNLGELYFSSSYKIAITPNEQYFTATLVLCIVFGGILLIGSVVILSMRRQYQQAKAEEVTRNLVNPENKFTKKKN